jgi:hypothetical protein
MTRILLALFLLFGCSEDRPEELVIMNTVCIDGYVCFSVMSGLECDYIPVIHDGKKVRCEDE